MIKLRYSVFYRQLEGKDDMTTASQPILYKVWLPGQSPTLHEPTLTLHNEEALAFFVESVSHGTTLFTGRPIAIVAYYVANQLMERQVAEGTYRLEQPDAPYLQGGSPLQVLYESGIKTEASELGIISAALIDALAIVMKEREQVL